MKRILLTAAAFIAAAAPLTAPAAVADPQRGGYSDHRDSRYDRDGRHDSKVVVHKRTTIWRDARPNARWDARQHNGYYIRNEWHYGQPSANAYRTRGFQLGYKPWARGDRLGAYNNGYREVNYRDYRLNAPPRGYHYVRDDNTGEIILAAIATGIIASIILN